MSSETQTPGDTLAEAQKAQEAQQQWSGAIGGLMGIQAAYKPAVYGAISAVARDLSAVGIAKSRQNQQQGYAFRGIDEVYTALAPLLPKHGLIVVPRVLHREQVERTSRSGSAQFYTTVEAEFDFIAVADGSRVTAKTFGEAQDSGDKSTNKAMSAAYKYAAFQTFCIPTEGDNDADAHTPEPVEPKGYSEWLLDFEATADSGYAAMQAAWKAAPEAFRKFLPAAKKDALKAKAQRVNASTEAA